MNCEYLEPSEFIGAGVLEKRIEKYLNEIETSVGRIDLKHSELVRSDEEKNRNRKPDLRLNK